MSVCRRSFVFRDDSTPKKTTGPGSFYEVRKLLPLLTASSPEYPSFHVVSLSLPGYGFSETPRKQGFAIKQYAEVCSHLYMRSITHFYP